jgi:hypothetical protein
MGDQANADDLVYGFGSTSLRPELKYEFSTYFAHRHTDICPFPGHSHRTGRIFFGIIHFHTVRRGSVT